MASRRSTRDDAENGVRFSRTIFIALIVMSGALIAFDQPDSRSQAFANFRAGFTDIAAPLLELAAQPVRAVKGIGPYFRRQGELAEENAELRRQLIEARYWEDIAYRQRDRIEVYEAALNVQTPATQDRIGAWTVADPRGPFVQARLIGRGSQSGVADGYPVINLYGLVGRVYETGQRSSRVLLLTDLNSRVPVMVDRSNARAILVGDNSEYPRLDYLGRNPDVEAGDRLVSSGDDGILPRGLPVGQAVPTREGGWRVELYSDQAPIDFVWVWPFQPALGPEAEAEEELAPGMDGLAVEGVASQTDADSVTSDAPQTMTATIEASAETSADIPGDTVDETPNADTEPEDAP